MTSRIYLILLLGGVLAACGGAPTTLNTTDTPPPSESGEPVPAPVEPVGEDWQQALVAAHNAWRAEVGVPPLRWSDEVAAYAQAWATTLQADGCALRHRSDSPYGENLAWSSGTTLAPEQVVAMWGNEREHYAYESNTCAPGEVCGHYTQVVWRTTEVVGCGRARCGPDEVWVCNYDPPGNWAGEKPY